MFSSTDDLPAITTLELPVIPADEVEQAARARPGSRRRHPLYRSGYSLVVNTAGTTVVGVAYWAIAAHLYGKEALGRSSALVSALILLSSLSQLNLSNALPRFLPQTGRAAGRFIGYSYCASAAAAMVAAVAFVTVLPRIDRQWVFLGSSRSLSLLFVGAAVIWGVFALEDAALTGLHKAVVVPVENTAYGVLKLGALVALAALLPGTGIFVSWVMPLALVVPVINWLIFRRYARADQFLTKVSRVTPRTIVRFASVDYLGSLLSQAYGNLLPLLVLSMVGAVANGSFYIDWSITSGLSLIAANFGTSFLVEAAAAPDRLAELTRGVLARSLALTVAGVLGLIILAHPILAIYGHGYTAGTTLLVILAVATVPRSLVQLTWSLDRVAGQVGRAARTQGLLAILVLGGSWVLSRRLGVEGVGLAWMGSNTLMALVRLPTIIGAARPGARALAVRREPPSAHPVLVVSGGKGRRRQPGRHRGES